MAVASAKKFLRTMAQPFKAKDQEGISTWSLRDLERHEEKMERERMREMNAHEMNGMNGRVTEIREDEFDDEEAVQAMMMEVDA